MRMGLLCVCVCVCEEEGEEGGERRGGERGKEERGRGGKEECIDSVQKPVPNQSAQHSVRTRRELSPQCSNSTFWIFRIWRVVQCPVLKTGIISN